jgi:dTDP-4-amino-4,6-dideoxygalactose transaminase
MGEIACFSFYPGKNLGAYGDAGAITTSSPELDLEVRKLHDHGGVKKYHHDLVGYNSRLDSLQAAVLSIKLARLDEWNAVRRERARQYQTLLAGANGIRLPPPDNSEYQSVHHLFVIQVMNQKRDELKDYLADQKVGSGIHYPKPVHLTEAFGYLGYPQGSFPAAERAAGGLLSLPMFPELTCDHVSQVCELIHRFSKEAF